MIVVSSYSEFPNADTITRRLKKLTQLIGKAEDREGNIDFESQDENELQGWDLEDKKKFFKFVSNFGVILNNEGKPNWIELRERITKEPELEKFSKNITEIEMFVDKLRIKCKHIVDSKENKKEESKQESDEIPDLKLSYEEALKFHKNYELLYFLRRVIIPNKLSLLVSNIEDLKKATLNLSEGDPGFVPEGYDPAIHDK